MADAFVTPDSDPVVQPAKTGFQAPATDPTPSGPPSGAFKAPATDPITYDANGTPSNEQLRAIFDTQKHQGTLSKAGDFAVGMVKGLGSSLASVPGAVWEHETAPKITDPETWPATGEKLKAAWQRLKEGDLGSAVGEVAQIPAVQAKQKELSSVLEGASGGAAGLAQMAYKPLKYLGHDLPQNLGDPEGEFDRWKADYLTKLALSRQSVSQSAQEALGAAPGDTVAPNPHQAEVAALATQLPAFEAGAAGLGAGRAALRGAPAVVGDAGQGLLGKTLPESALTRNIAPAANREAAALTQAMKKPVEAVEAGAALPEVTPGLGVRAAAGTGRALSKVGGAMKAVGGAPEQFVEWVANKVTGSPALTEKVGGAAKLLENLSIPAAFLGAPGLVKAIAAVRGLEAAGALTKGLGDFMTRLAEADPTSPFGRFASLAADTSAPEWMQQIAKSPAVRLAITSGRLGGDALKGYAKAGAVGGALGVASGDDAEELGGDVAGMGIFGALHGLSNSGHAKVFEANLGNVTRFVTESLEAGVSPETLRQVSADQILNAATWEKLLPGWKVRFATSTDANSPFAAGKVAEGQAGVPVMREDGSKTLWVDPSARGVSRTLIHEAFHPLFDSLVEQHPDIKATLDRALAADGKTVGDVKAGYASAAYPKDAQQAAAYIKAQDQANPNWAYSELLSETAQHHLNGANLVSAAQGGNTAPTATDIALRTAEGWLKGNGVQFKESATGTVLPGFDNVIATPELRRLTHRLLEAQQQVSQGNLAKEAGTPLTAQDMGTAKAPFYPAPDGRLVNPYGTLVDNGKGGQKFVAFPPSEVRRRLKAEQVALDKYFPKGQKVAQVPAAFWDDPGVNPWTKASLRTLLDSTASGKSLEGWYHRLNKENSATSNRSWAADVARSAGNVAVSLQSGFPLGVKRSKEGNLLVDWASMEAARQKVQAWARRQGPASLEMWGGDSAKFFQDAQTYLKNHADGQPGESNGIGQQKRDVLNAFWFGDNKEFQAKNPLRAGLRKADRQGVFRSLRADRMETMTPQESEFSRPDWERGKMNFSPSSDPRAVKAAALMDEKGDIYEGPYHAAAGEKYWETKFPGDPSNALRAWTLTPNLIDGFTTNTTDPVTGKPEFLTRAEAFQRAQELGQYKPTGRDRADDAGQLESTRFNRQAAFSPGDGSKIEIEGPDGRKYAASHDGTQDFSVLGLGHMAQITPLEDLPGGPVAKSTAYAKSLQEKGFKLPDHLTWSAPEAVGQSIITQAAQERRLFSPPNVIDIKAPDVKKKGVNELSHTVGPETLRLLHLSSRPDLKTADPKFFGKGRANNNDQRGGPKTFWFVEGSPLAGDADIFGQGGYHAYTAEVSGKKLYDLSAEKDDPLGYFNNPNRWEADTKLQKAGYDGVLVETTDDRKVVMLYKSQRVKAAGEFQGNVARPLADRDNSGLEHKGFFSNVTKGTFGKSDVPFEPILPPVTPGQKAFAGEYAKHTGNFDEHIAKSIPGFRESQVRTGAGIARTFGNGADMLDIAASEGSYGKTISALTKGKVRTVSLDPDPDMANFFATKSKVPGATYDTSAFLAGFDDGGKFVPAYNPAKRFDVVHESMGFQFISPDREAQIAEAKRLMKPDGVLLTEQKVRTEDWAANEAKKDTGHKAKYFSKQELAAKDKVVGFQQSKHETQKVGMVANMATDKGLEAVLAKHFKHVVQYWDSGNFKGYAAGDDAKVLGRLVRNIGDLNTDYSTVKTPRKVEAPKQFSPAADSHAVGSFDEDGKLQAVLNPSGDYVSRGANGVAGAKPWTYNATTKTVTYHEGVPGRKQQAAVAAWLKERGYPVTAHTKAEGSFAFSPGAQTDELSAGPDLDRRAGVRAGMARGAGRRQVMDKYGLRVEASGEGFAVRNGFGETLGDFPDEQTAHSFAEAQESAPMFSPKTSEEVPGIVGNLDTDDNFKVHGVSVPDIRSDEAAHFHTTKTEDEGASRNWRYRPDEKTVYWWRHPDAEAKEAVEGWLAKQGLEVEKHTRIGRYDGQEFRDAHGGQTERQSQARADAIEAFYRSRKFSPKAEDQDTGGFFSQLSKVVDATFSGKEMPAAQLAAILRNPQNGVKADELKWTGLDDFLKGKGRVTREEVQDYLAKNRVEVKETQHGGVKSLTAEDRDEMASMANRLLEENYYREPAAEGDLELDDAAKARVSKQLQRLLQAAKDGNPSEMRQAANKLGDYYESWGLDSTLATKVESKVTRFEEKLDTPSTKFEQYQLPGGENYREVLFTLPETEKNSLKAQADAIRDSITKDIEKDPELLALQGRLKEAHRQGALWEDHPDNVAPPGYDNADHFAQWLDTHPYYARQGEVTGEGAAKARKLYNIWAWRDLTKAIQDEWSEKLQDRFGDRYSQITELQGKSQDTGFKSNHWDEPNVLAHTRVNDRTDSAGKPGLFCEEIQSDWHQKGRKEGYSQTVPAGEGWTAEEISPGAWRVRDIDGGWRGSAQAATREEAIRKVAETLPGNKTPGVPDAPFKTTWHEMVFRRLVQMAAEQGKDWLGWTTGEQQAERYDLSKQVAHIKAVNLDGDNYIIKATPHNSAEIKKIVSKDKLADLIGKDLAEKVVADNPKQGDQKLYSGLDLKVGGEGMRGFYDKMLVDYANKFGKKFGAKVEEREIPGGGGGKAYPWALMQTDGEVYDVYRTQDEAIDEGNRLAHVDATLRHMKVVPNPEGTSAIHSLPITPEMKASVKQGVQLFSPKADGEPARNIKWPAVRFTDEAGTVWEYSAPRHAEAEQKLVDALGYTPHYNKVQDGFVTYGGKFLDRTEGYARARETGQYSNKGGDNGMLIAEQTRGMAPREQFSPAAQQLLGGGEAPDMPAIEHMTAQEIADHWPESAVPKVRDEKLGFDIADSPLAKQAGSEPAAVSAYADKLVATAKDFEANPIYQSGLKWYSEFVPLLKKEFGKQAELMGHLLAALSPRTNPTVNFAFALDALEMFKRGHFDAKLKKYAQGVRMLENGTLERWYKARATKGQVEDAPQKAGPGTWLEEWTGAHDLYPRQSNGQLYGTRSHAVLDVLAGRWLEQNEGPKVKNFVQNLLGTGHEATIDVWAARLMRRLGYEGLKPRWRILPKNETGVSDPDFFFSQKAFRQAAEKLGVSPDALQGGLWFAEKKLWADKGWAPLDLGDYRKEMKKVDLLRQGIDQRLARTKAAAKAKPVEQGALQLD